jgi:ankyrin repeat protein
MKRCFELAAEGNLEELKPLLGAGHHQRRARNERGRTLLHVAAESGQKKVAQHLLDLARSSVDLQDNDGNTALHLAVLKNHVEVADSLLASGASAVIQNHRKVLPFHVALHADSQSTDMIKAFCKYNIDHLARGVRNYTSLHVVAARNNLTALQILYEAAVSSQLDIKSILQLQAVDRDGLTPVHLAARKGSYDVLDFMISKAIEHGLKPQNAFRYLSEKESTPLHFAVESNSLEIVRILLKYGASPIAMSGKQSTPVHLACSQNKLNMVEEMVEQCGNEILNCKNDQGQIPLHSSSSLMGGKQLISFLLSKGSPLDAQDANGHTPLQVAVRYGNIASMEQLLASGSSPLIKDASGCSCLHIAVMFKRREVFKRLLKHPKITETSNAVNNDGDLPIHLALREGLSTFITPLLTSTHHQITDKDDNNYFHLAALAGDDKTIENLLTRSFAESMINATNSSGKTPLHCSAISGNLACIYLLLDHGAMVNKCHCGRTPFMYACSEGRLLSAKVLYEAHPFQRDWEDDQGSTALHLAAKSGSSEVTNYCLDVGVVISLDNQQFSFFDIIIDAINSNLAISVLQHQRWQECLDTSCPTKPHPVMRLIDLIPSAFHVILNQSIQRSPLDPKHKDYWEKYDFKYISLPLGPPTNNTDDVNLDKDDSMESNVLTSDRKSRPEDTSSLSSVQPEVQLQMETLPGNKESTKAPEEGTLELESSHAIHQSTISDSSTPIDKEEKILNLPAQDVHTDHQTETIDGERKSDSVPTMKVLKLLAKNQHKQCLTHPLVTKYLFLKWVDYARTLYISKCLLVLLMAIFLSTFIGISPIPFQLDLTTVENETISDSVSKPEISIAANVIRFITIFFAILNGILWLATIYVLRLKLITHFVKEFEFWLYGCAIITTLIYLIPFSGLNSVIYEAGAIAVFTTWIVALLQIELFGVVGIYVSMLISTTKNVLKVLAVCFFLFCAFAFAFHILVGSISELQFTNVGTSLVSSISSALAIVDLNTFVALESSLRFRILVFIFYVLLLIILPIVVINLLIGLAVGDIAKIQEDAEIDRQVFIVTNLSKIDEHLLPHKVVLRFYRESYMHYPNNFGETWLTRGWRKFLHLLSACSDQAVSIQPEKEEASPEAREGESVSLEECQRQIKLLAQTQAKQTDTLTRMEVILQKLMENQGLNNDN